MTAYRLGVDLGTTYTAAAVARDGRPEAFTLGTRRAAIPSVVYAASDRLLVGEAAARRAASEPDRVAREFKRRVGDPTPLVLGGSPVAPELLMARLLAWVVEQVTTTEGEPPSGLLVTHPANWGEYKLDLLRQAIRHVGLTVDRFVPEPVAAATFYAAQRELSPGTVVAVYDLGGGTFDAAVLRTESEGFGIVGRPDGIERLGGIDFDHAVLAHVLGTLGFDLDSLYDLEDRPDMRATLRRLREECVEGKEALSAEADVSVPVFLPTRHVEVRLTRSELEAMIRPALEETLAALRRAIDSAELRSGELSAVLLVGGSSRIPLVAQLVTADLGCPVALDARPKDAISMGAALIGTPAEVETDRLGHPPTAGPSTVAPPPFQPPPPQPPPAPVPVGPPLAPPRPQGSPWKLVLGAMGLVVGIGAWLLYSSDDGDGTLSSSTTTTSQPDPTTTGSTVQPTGEQVTSGGLSFPRLEDPWQEASGDRFAFDEIDGGEGDFVEVEQWSQGSYTAFVLVAALAFDVEYTGVDDLEDVCDQLAIMMAEKYYQARAGDPEIGPCEDRTVDDHPASLVEFEIPISDPELDTTSENVTVMVVDTGGSRPGVFYATVPDVYPELSIDVERALGSLRVAE